MEKWSDPIVGPNQVHCRVAPEVLSGLRFSDHGLGSCLESFYRDVLSPLALGKDLD
jgi:hypothetical protein